MGADKALARLGGRTLVEIALGVLRQAGLTARIAGVRPPLEAFAPLVAEDAPGLGPLAGVCAGLAASSARFAVFLPVDMPLLPASLVAHLLHRAQITGSAVTLPSVNGFAQTFPAILGREALPPLSAELAAARLGCFAGFEAVARSLAQPLSVVPVELLLQAGQVAHPAALPAVCWFLNVNTPADLRRAQALTGTDRVI